ncbi:uncharacterized protein LOC124457372 isoform X3 [Xenia sp. Carnegie-2017]|uniref:uncharacterized protein LOC124457372 isoform X3 n=1 Tax=Xenia sp. Carnegie-2017 TaxID=2897299 RepID=UPI001F049FE0|nr:uncharacterized protein LOC124457372 isoform X3 [Xenia sp. Carnegie-2017]
MISSSTKAFLWSLIILSICGQIVNGNDDISICKKSLETLKDNVEEWMETCVDKDGNDDNTTACKEVKQYNKEMMQMQTEMCFYEEFYPKPYLIIMSFDKVYTVDSITGDIHVSSINGSSKNKFDHASRYNDIEIDVVENVLYYIDDKDIKRGNFDLTRNEIFAKNVSARDITVDWIGRRIFYIDSTNIIYQICLKKKITSVMRLQPGLQFSSIAFDSKHGYLFLAESTEVFLWLWSMTANKHHIFSVSIRSIAHDLTLDMVKEKIYWRVSNGNVFSCDYYSHNVIDFGTSGGPMAIFGDFIYIMTNVGGSVVSVHNTTDQRTRRKFFLPVNNGYLDLAVAIHATKTFRFPSCGPYTYYRKINGTLNCTCMEGFSGECNSCQAPAFSSCKEALKDNSSTDGAYMIKTNTSLGYSKVFCKKIISGCFGEGWTLVMKIDGNKKTFQYNSSLWSNKESYKTENGETGLGQNETKLPTYWSTQIKKMCVGMKVNSKIKFISFEIQAESLYELIADGKYRKTTLSRSQWLTLVENSSLQQYCDREGFNVVGLRGGDAEVKLGILGNNENECISPDSFIGFGGSHDCNFCGVNSCGNFVSWSSNDKNVRTMGYILLLSCCIKGIA